MKKTLLILICSILNLCYVQAKSGQPSWVTQAPVVSNAYIGIASAPITDNSYRESAQISALNNLAAQISIDVESNSFLTTTEINGDVKEQFELKIKESLKAYLTGYELVDSYTSDSHFYIYYKLDKAVYKKYIETKRKEMTQIGLDYFAKGKQAEQVGDIILALSIYVKGMAAVEPYLNLSLDGLYDGRYVNVATELYVAYKGIFTGMALTSNITQLSVNSLSSSREAIGVCLSKNGVVIPNMLLNATFTSGEGELTPSTKTDYTGTAVFYLTNVISKNDIQTINITIDPSVTADLSDSFKSLISTVDWPVANITVAVVDKVIKAYFDVGNNDIPTCESQVRSIFANNYFEISEDVESDLYIAYSTTLTLGKEIDGELYKMNECYCSLSVKIYNNSTQSLLGEYATSEVRVLVPINKSADQTIQMCARELMKKYKVGLPAVLKGIQL